ncbi:nucleotidyltransferase domain-containing protein [bacterium]|nr:nucleotidyltransferase domain-containing protein [bacterium]
MTSFLSSVLNKKSLKIFKHFFVHKQGEFSGREISQFTKLNHMVCLKELEQLVAVNLLQKKRVGASYLFSVLPSVYWESIIFPLLKSEKNILVQAKKDIVDVLGKQCSKIIIFGSYARGEQTVNSDLDVCFVTEEKKKVQRAIEQFRDVFFQRYQCHLSDYVVTPNQYKTSSLAIIRDIHLEGTCIYGH